MKAALILLACLFIACASVPGSAAEPAGTWEWKLAFETNFANGKPVEDGLCLTVGQGQIKDGKLVIADISFRSAAAMSRFARSVGDLWEVEPYWLADEATGGLEAAGIQVEYVSVSACAGVYALGGAAQLHARD